MVDLPPLLRRPLPSATPGLPRAGLARQRLPPRLALPGPARRRRRLAAPLRSCVPFYHGVSVTHWPPGALLSIGRPRRPGVTQLWGRRFAGSLEDGQPPSRARKRYGNALGATWLLAREEEKAQPPSGLCRNAQGEWRRGRASLLLLLSAAFARLCVFLSLAPASSDDGRRRVHAKKPRSLLLLPRLRIVRPVSQRGVRVPATV